MTGAQGLLLKHPSARPQCLLSGSRTTARQRHADPHSRTPAAAAAASPAAFLSDHQHHGQQEQQQDGLHQLRLLAPQLLAASASNVVPTRNQLAPQPQTHPLQQLQPQQQQEQQQEQQHGVAVDAEELFAAETYLQEAWALHDDSTMQQPDGQHSLTGAAVSDAPVHLHKSSNTTSSSSSAIKPKQLMVSIAAAGSVSELQALHQAHHACMDHVHLARMLNRLAHTWAAAAKQAQRTRKAQRRQQQQQQQQQQLAPIQRQQHHQQHAVADVGADQQEESSLLASGASAAAEAVAAPPPHPGQAAYEEAVQLLRVLLRDLVSSTHLPNCSSRELSSALWVVGRFSRAAAAHSDIQQAVAALLKALLMPPPALEADSSAAAAVSVAAGLDLQHQQQHQQQQHEQDVVAVPPSTAVMAAGSEAVGVCSSRLQAEGNAADIQNTMWALGRLAQVLDVHSLLSDDSSSNSSSSGIDSSSSVLVHLDQLCSQQLSARRAYGQFVANCLYGFAHLAHPAPHTFDALVARANPNYCKTLQSQHVVCITWAAARLGHYCPQLFSRLTWRAVVVRGALYPQGVAMMLAGCARAGHSPDPRAVAQLLQVCKAQWWKLRGKHLSNLVWGLLRTNTLQHHNAFFMGLLLCQVTVKLHELQPVGVATILQALLQASRTAPQYSSSTRGERMLASGRGQGQGKEQAVAAAGGGGGRAAEDGAGDGSRGSSSSDDWGGVAVLPPHSLTVAQRLQQQQQQGGGGSGCLPPRLPVSAAAIARAQIGMSAALSGHCGDTNSQLQLLLRQMGAHIVAQLPQTTPQTLYNVIISLAGVGYYEPRLYTRLAAAAAAAAAAGGVGGGQANTNSSNSSSSVEQEQQCVYSAQQSLQLLCAFSSFQHAAPELWQQLLPGLAAGAGSLSQQQLTHLVSAAAAAFAVGTGGPSSSTTAAATGTAASSQHATQLAPAEMRMLLQVAAAALQCQFEQQQQQQWQQQAGGLTAGQVQRLVQLVDGCTALVAATTQQLLQQRQQLVLKTNRANNSLLLSVLQQTDRLVVQLAVAVCAQPQLLPWSHLLKLLHSALLLQTPSITQALLLPQQQQQPHTSSSGDNGDHSCSSSSTQPAWRSSVSPRVLQQLSSLAQDHPQHMSGSGSSPQDLVLLLRCHTHPALHTCHTSSGSSSNTMLLLADGYAEALLGCIGRCSVQTLVSLLQVLAEAWQQPGQARYGNVGLVAAAARQLHSRVRLATAAQLAAAVGALEVLQQQQTPLYRIAVKLMGS